MKEIGLPEQQLSTINNEGKVIFKSIVSEGEVEENVDNANFTHGKDIFLNRMFSLVNEFYWPKSKISVAYTKDNNVVEKEPVQSKATISELPVSI